MRIGYVKDQPGCSAADQELVLLTAGIPKDRIWMEGRGGETLKECLRAMRGKVVELEIAYGLRPLGNTDDEVESAVDMIHAAGKIVLDPLTGLRSGPGDGHKMFVACRKRWTSEATGLSDKKYAMVIGRKGGRARAEQIKYEQNTKDRRMWFDHKKFKRDMDVAFAIGRSRSALINAYGPSGRPKGRRRKQKT